MSGSERPVRLRITHHAPAGDMRLADILAQDIAVRALRSSIRRERVAHAYLFTGPRGSGKTTAAVAFASALNCQSPTPEGDACGLCMSCIRIEGGDPDVQVISPDGDQTKMEQMQEMIRGMNYAPLSGKYRVVIIEQADTLNPSSENAILKILEEPPAYAVLVLLSGNPNSLLPTIRSRCRTVRFRRAQAAEVERALIERRGMSEDEARTIAACSQGLIGRAFTLAAGDRFVEERQIVLQGLKRYLESPPITALLTAEEIAEIGARKKTDADPRTKVQRLTEMLDHILSWYDDLLSMKVRGREDVVTNADYLPDLRALSDRYSEDRLRKALRRIMDTRRWIEGNVTPQLALENMFFALRPDV